MIRYEPILCPGSNLILWLSLSLCITVFVWGFLRCALLIGHVRLGIRIFCLVVYLAFRSRTYCLLKKSAGSLAKIIVIVNLDKIPRTIRTA